MGVGFSRKTTRLLLLSQIKYSGQEAAVSYIHWGGKEEGGGGKEEGGGGREGGRRREGGRGREGGKQMPQSFFSLLCLIRIPLISTLTNLNGLFMQMETIQNVLFH